MNDVSDPNRSPKVRWGFVGAGANARESLAPATHDSRLATLQAVASRDLTWACALDPVGVCYSRYEDLLSDPEVDAVYVCLANDGHLPWTLAALAAGFPVMCEKPLALSAAAVDLIAAAQARCGQPPVVEACWYLWNPRIRRLQALVAEGCIGPVTGVRATFCSRIEGGGYRFDPRLGGGVLYDLGCYVISAAVRAFSDSSPLSVSGRWRVGPTGVDEEATARVSFATGEARLRVSFGGQKEQLRVEGRRGYLAINRSAFTSNGQARGQIAMVLDGVRSVLTVQHENPYRIMVDEVSSAFAGSGGWLYPLSETRTCAAVLDAWRQSASNGGSEAPVRAQSEQR